MPENHDSYWAMRNVEFQLQAAIKERDALKEQVTWLRRQLQDVHAKLDLSYTRYHDIARSHAGVLDRALERPKTSTVNNVMIDERSLLLLKNPVIPSRL